MLLPERWGTRPSLGSGDASDPRAQTFCFVKADIRPAAGDCGSAPLLAKKPNTTWLTLTQAGRKPDRIMNRSRSCFPAVLAASLLPLTTDAAVLVSGTVRPSGGAFHYEISIANTGPEDVALVTFTDAPLGDPLIGPSLSAPAGYVASYDGGQGFLDFLGLASDLLGGTQAGPFRFDSLAGPGTAFGAFESTDVAGLPSRGTVDLTVIPEPVLGGTALALGLLGSALVCRRRSPQTVPPLS